MKKGILGISVAAMALCANAQTPENEEVEYNQYGQKVEALPAQASFQDGVMVFQNKEHGFKMWFDTRVQADAGFFFGGPDWTKDEKIDGKLNPDHIGNGATLRRTRFAVKAQLGKNWYGEIDADFTRGSFELKDAIVGFTGVKGLEIKVGNFKENFSMNRNSTSRYLLFMERPMVTYLAPSRHLGINATYDNPYVWGAFGVFGPEVEGEALQTLSEDNNKAGQNEGLSYTGKLVLRPFGGKGDFMLHVGGAYSYRMPKTSAEEGYRCVRYSTRNSTSINRKKYVDTDVITGVDHEVAYTAEIAGLYKGLRFEGAYIARGAFLDRAVNDKDTQWFDGWYGEASYLLFGGKQNYDAGGAKFTRITPGKKWGDLEFAVRYQTIDLNSKDYYGGASSMWQFGLNFYPHKNVKLVVNYGLVNNDRYANGKGKLLVGHDADGKPTKDYTKVVDAKGKAGVDYSQLTFRAQIAF